MKLWGILQEYIARNSRILLFVPIDSSKVSTQVLSLILGPWVVERRKQGERADGDRLGDHPVRGLRQGP